jgi:peptidylprolyl isomerase
MSKIKIETTQGSIEFELFEDVAPLACENFTTHIKNGYYDGVLFYRIIADFMIQGGDPTGSGRGGKSIWGKPFKDECVSTHTFNRPGLLAMANAGPGTNGSQFFITTTATPWLNMKHTIFGEVVAGMETIRSLESVQKGPGDRPVEDQKIIRGEAIEAS